MTDLDAELAKAKREADDAESHLIAANATVRLRNEKIAALKAELAEVKRDRDTAREVAKSNKRHVEHMAQHTELLDGIVEAAQACYRLKDSPVSQERADAYEQLLDAVGALYGYETGGIPTADGPSEEEFRQGIEQAERQIRAAFPVHVPVSAGPGLSGKPPLATPTESGTEESDVESKPTADAPQTLICRGTDCSEGHTYESGCALESTANGDCVDDHIHLPSTGRVVGTRTIHITERVKRIPTLDLEDESTADAPAEADFRESMAETDRVIAETLLKGTTVGMPKSLPSHIFRKPSLDIAPLSDDESTAHAPEQTPPKPMGWLVLTMNRESKIWQPDWDGELHLAEERAERECREANDSGHHACFGAFFVANDVDRIRAASTSDADGGGANG